MNLKDEVKDLRENIIGLLFQLESEGLYTPGQMFGNGQACGIYFADIEDSIKNVKRKMLYELSIKILEEAKNHIRVRNTGYICLALDNIAYNRFDKYPVSLFDKAIDNLKGIIEYGLAGSTTYEGFYQEYYGSDLVPDSVINELGNSGFFVEARMKWIDALIKQCKKEMKEIK